MRDLRDVQQDQIAALERRLESAKETIRQLRADLTTAQRRYDELAAATGLHPIYDRLIPQPSSSEDK